MVNHSGFLQQTKKEIKANFFSLGARSAAADCKKDLEDKVSSFLLNFAMTLFKLSLIVVNKS